MRAGGISVEEDMVLWSFLADSFQILEKSLFFSSGSVLESLIALEYKNQKLKNKKRKKNKIPEIDVKVSMRRSQDDDMPKIAGRLSGNYNEFSRNPMPHYYFQISKEY